MFDDVGCCVELINVIYVGFDLFWFYSFLWFEECLYDLLWGLRLLFVLIVYGWDDMVVFFDGGCIVVCVGLWDKGRDVRECWCERELGE